MMRKRTRLARRKSLILTSRCRLGRADDSKSGGDETSSPTSTAPPATSPRAVPKNVHSILDAHSGVDSPDRFASKYDAPPPLSQRHLIEALGAEIKETANERGERDDIYLSDARPFMVAGQTHQIPSGRSALGLDSASEATSTEDTGVKAKGRRKSHHSGAPRSSIGSEGRPKAFAFFGQVGT
jgi:hypothetical protein